MTVRNKILKLCDEYGACPVKDLVVGNPDELIFMTLIKMRQDIAVLTAKYVQWKDEEFRLHSIISRFEESVSTFGRDFQ